MVAVVALVVAGAPVVELVGAVAAVALVVAGAPVVELVGTVVAVALVVAWAPVVELVGAVVAVALVVAEALMVELVGMVAAVAVPVWVAAVSPPPQPGLDPFPMASVLSQVSRVVFRLLRGLYQPALGLALAQECCLVLDLAPLSTELPPGSPLAESCLAPPAAEFGLDHPSVASHSVHPARLPFCFSSPSWASVVWGLHLLCLLGFLPGWRPHGSTFSPIRSWCWALLWSCP